jgi:hypothetical protein
VAEKDEYVEKSVNQQAIQFRSARAFKKSVYIWSGIKIAYPGAGTSISNSKSANKPTSAEGEISTSATGLLVGAR